MSPPDNERLTRGEVLQKQVGGAELNVASGASLLGLRTGVISKLPANNIGIYAKNRIRFCGVSDDYLVYDEAKDARLGIYYYENGAHPENRELSTTGTIPPCIRSPLKIFRKNCTIPQGVSIPAGSPWLWEEKYGKLPSI